MALFQLFFAPFLKEDQKEAFIFVGELLFAIKFQAFGIGFQFSREKQDEVSLCQEIIRAELPPQNWLHLKFEN